jgi:maltooligosyltrehalose trehalohydrolase
MVNMLLAEQAVTERKIGATFEEDGRCSFCVWAPKHNQVDLHLLTPYEQWIPMQPHGQGYFTVVVDAVAPGSKYFYHINGVDRPDPASRLQPEGVHGPSQVMSSNFEWTDQVWRGLPLDTYIFYEIHVGTFTAEGTFDAIIPRLDDLLDLGINAIELMPIAQFPGGRNWGYDGVYHYAVQNSYGGPEGLRRLVNACHERGLAVVLDTVYNHFGPEGSYVGEFGYYFSDCYSSPWGSCLNFDDAHSDDVRRFFLQNALYWFIDFHVDALRLDATDHILDFSSHTFLQQLSAAVHQESIRSGRNLHLIAENAQNDSRLVLPYTQGGYGMDAQWNDEFHHALRTLLTQDRRQYYIDFGSLDDLVKAFREGFVFTGQYSQRRKRSLGTPSMHIPPEQFVVFTQNHDHVGNRAFGERLGHLLTLDEVKMAAAAVILSPYLPLLFMGEEYNETSPFLFFVDFSDPDLIRAVREGRKREFSHFLGEADTIPDPEAEATFLQSKLHYDLRHEGDHAHLRDFYKRLIYLRKNIPALSHLNKDMMDVIGYENQNVLYVRRWYENCEAVMLFNFNHDTTALTLPLTIMDWRLELTSVRDDSVKLTQDDGVLTLPPRSFWLYVRS